MRAQQPPPGEDVPVPRHLKPPKETGYRGLSAFLASDSDFLIFRRFDTLNAGLLLYLQDQIVVLEERLEKLEDEHMADDAADMHHGSFRHNGLLERTQLFETLNGNFEGTVSCLFVV
jgi:hypothetical protein